jgi:hypothetical protein
MEVDDEARPITQIYGRNRRKTPQIVKSKIGPKIAPKIMKMENIAVQDRRWLMQIKSLLGVETTQTSSHSLEYWGNFSLLSSLF